MNMLSESLELRNRQFMEVFEAVRKTAEYESCAWPSTEVVRLKAKAIKSYAESLLWLCESIDAADFRYTRPQK